MKNRWLIEFRGAEVWAWACQDSLLLRLHRGGLGAIFDVASASNLGEFRWQTPDDPRDFDALEAEQWAALLEAQLADDASDLSLARRYAQLSPEQRVWQLVAFERGQRADFERALRFVLQREEVARATADDAGQSFWNGALSAICFRIDDVRLLTWHCANTHVLSSGGRRVPDLRARVRAITQFFAPHRDTNRDSQMRARVEEVPLLFEMHAPLKFRVPIGEQALTAHENLECALHLRALFARHLAPDDAAVLLRQISPATQL